jgi:prepilin-type processing-associated H-X9-DG protein
MFKAMSLATRMTAIIGLMAALPSLMNMQQKLKEQGGDPNAILGMLNGSGANSNAGSLQNLMELLTGQTAGGAPKQAPAPPPKPMVAITYDSDRGTSAEEVPPGANATFVDGHLQVYYPNGKPKGKK